MCDPEEIPDLSSRLTGVNSIVFGEFTTPSDPTICLDKEAASSTEMLTSEAKHEVESATAGDIPFLMVHDTLAQVEIELPGDYEERAKDDKFGDEGIKVVGQMSFNGPKTVTAEEEGVEVIGQTKFNGPNKTVSPFGTVPLRHSTTCPIY